jgi:hypothetical protein
MAGKRGETRRTHAPSRVRGKSGPVRKDRLFADTLVSVLGESDKDDVKKLRKVAGALVDKAMTGDTAAIREIADRVDGKAGPAAERQPEGKGTLVVKIVRHGEDGAEELP